MFWEQTAKGHFLKNPVGIACFTECVYGTSIDHNLYRAVAHAVTW